MHRFKFPTFLVRVNEALNIPAYLLLVNTASLAIRTIHQNPYPSTPFLRSVDAWLLLYLVQDSLQGNLHTPSSRFRFLTPIAASRRI
jgi:hypothetical protein